MREPGAATWIEQRIAELERSITAWKIEIQRRRANGSEDEMDPDKVAQIEMWEKECKGLTSLRDERRLEET